jgi:signal transduction histidine kinase
MAHNTSSISISLLSSALTQMQTGLAIVEITYDRHSPLPKASYPITFANASFATMFGFPDPDSVSLRDIRSFTTAKDAEQFSHALELGMPQTLTLLHTSQDGTLFHAQVQIAPVSDDSTSPTHIICTYTDITDLVQTNDTLTSDKEQLEGNVQIRTKELQEFIDQMRNELNARRLLEIELRNAEKRYRSLSQNFPSGAVIMLGTDKECILCEGVLAEKMPILTAQHGKKYLGEPLRIIAESSIDAAFEGDRHSFEIQIESEAFLVQVVPIIAENNSIDAVMLVVQNIADFKARQELEQEREMTALKYRFVTIASHELRTPLAGMMLSSGILRRYWDTASEEDKRESVADIIVGLDRMAKLIDDILFVGKSDAGRLAFNPYDMDVAALCRKLILECKKGVGQHHTTVQEIPEQVTTIHADQKLLELMITNLLSNAYKYSPQGSDVHVAVHTSETDVRLVVRDTGIGIPVDDIPNLFKSFYRAKNVGEIQGTGLGLAMVERVVVQHGGKIRVESTEAKGTIFEVMLPKVQEQNLNVDSQRA